MNCKILHESSSRLRIHVKHKRLSTYKADQLEFYIRQLDGSKKSSM